MSRTYGKLKQEALLGKLPYGKKVKAIKKDLMKGSFLGPEFSNEEEAERRW